MTWRDLVIASLLQPRLAARVLIGAGLPPAIGWMLFGLGIVLSALLGHLANGLMAVTRDLPRLSLSPFSLTLLQAMSQVLVLVAAHHLGRFEVGLGRFADILILIAWIEILLVAVQALDLALLAFLPNLAGVLPAIGVVITLWIMANFLAEAHGFPSPWPVLAAIIGVSMLFGLVLVSALKQFGLQIGAQNV
jgi:hypothetical protein